VADALSPTIPVSKPVNWCGHADRKPTPQLSLQHYQRLPGRDWENLLTALQGAESFNIDTLFRQRLAESRQKRCRRRSVFNKRCACCRTRHGLLLATPISSPVCEVVPMPSVHCLLILTELREQAGLSLSEMARRFGLDGTQSRKTVGAWEHGEMTPRKRWRGACMRYLWDDLGLRKTPDQFAQVWAILVEQWGWEPISDQEWHAFTVTPRQATDTLVTPTTDTPPLAQLPGAPVKAQSPPTRSGDQTNLPVAFSSFIGREHEIAEIQRLITSHRLLTLTGVGGCGKTRLAIESATQLAPLFGRRVWLVDLSALVEPALVPQAIASTLGIFEEPGVPLITTLVTTLAPYQTLLVLDNCEHLIDACGSLVNALLCRCPNLRVVATSRETLDILGERVWPVQPLAVPPHPAPSDRCIEPRDLLDFAAVRLFVERAQAAAPDFAIDAEILSVIGEICRQLDGIPLAIELAAARVRALSVQQIAARLHDSMRVLASRHRTMAATLDWSYELLSEPERIALRRLSVFAGGWSLEAAVSVCADDALPAATVPDLLSDLVHKSLVVAWQRRGDVRYRMLEPVRHYASAHLLAAREQTVVQDRHVAYFAGFIRRAAAYLTGADQVAWFKQLELEFDNLRMALDRTIDVATGTNQQDLVIQALALPADLERFWSPRGHIREGSERLSRALALPGAQAPNVAVARAYALNAAGILAWFRVDCGEAQRMLEEAYAIGVTTQDRRTILIALRNLGTLAVLERDFRLGSELLERGLIFEREVGGGDAYSAAWMVTVLGSAAYLQGDDTQACAYFEESVARFRALGDANFLALALRRLGQIALRSGAAQRAPALLRESLELNSQIGSPGGIAACMGGVAGVLLAQGRPADAARLLGSAQALLNETADQLIAIDREMFDTLLAQTRAWLGTAFDAAWAEGQMGQWKAVLKEYDVETLQFASENVLQVQSTAAVR
jgi:predicted ATPase